MSEPQYSNRQLQIINAAIKLMGKGGIQQLTTKNLALEVGVTEPALYRHFSNKTDLILQVLEYLKSRIMQESSAYYLKVINEGQDSGDFRRDVAAERIAFMVMGSMRFCVIQWHLSGNSYDLVPKGKDLLSTFFTLLKK